MADINIKPEIALGIKQPDTMTNIGQMVNLAAGIQEFKKARELLPYAIEAGKAQSSSAKSAAEEALLKVKQAQMTTETKQLEFDEQKNLSALMQSPELWQDKDGKPDLAKLNKLVPMYAPRTGKEFLKGFTELSTAQTTNEQAALKLSTDERNVVANRLQLRGRMGEKDPNVYIQDLKQLKEEFPKSKGMQEYIDSLEKLYSKAQPSDQVPGMAIRLAETFMSPGTFAPAVSAVDTGAGTKFVTTTPSVGGQMPTVDTKGGAFIERKLGPAQKEVPNGRTDAYGRPLANVYDDRGNLIGEKVIAAGVSTPPPSPQPNPQAGGGNAQQPRTQPRTPPAAEAPVRLPVGVTPEMFEESKKIRSSALDYAGTYQTQLHNNNQIIDLAGKATTGAGASVLANLAGGFAPVPWTGDKATYFNELGHYLDQQASLIAQSPGYGSTNAAREMAQSVSGQTNYTAESLKNIARTNRALATGAYLFSQGVENGSNKHPENLVYAREFKNKWNSIADIKALRLYDATANNDQEEIKRITKGMSTEEINKLKLKVKTIINLANGE